ncbi:C39 family peptidase [Paraburkholderia unamae]|uniref:Peptidase C39-like protein n=1 Tax=Paraburkholderia unamae TaxID=219649 RepID=A0ABX5KJ90_9BURK|nr:C39 family peptidase [Paraburkholderia unamae]PVX75233.1 peptidase C39-like protein [Paraburkholderia unamae]
MANFQKVPNDHATRLDTGAGRLVLMLEEKVKIDLYGGGPNGEDLVVDLNDTSIGSVSEKPVKRNAHLLTYEIQGLKSGNAMLEARLFSQAPESYAARRKLWFTMPVWAYIQVSVMGAEYRQRDGLWGNLKYGSINPKWKDVKWTNMAQAGCGPTSLSIVMDYLIRLDSPYRNLPASFPGLDPKEAMQYTSEYGRAADKKGEPSGTSGTVMIENIRKYWPDYEGAKVASVDAAATLLRQGNPLVFLCKNCSTYRYDEKGHKLPKMWPGHFMVLLGVEQGDKTFWITDPSSQHHKYIDKEELKKTTIWHIYKRPGARVKP